MRVTMGIVRESRDIRLGLYTESCLGLLSAAEQILPRSLPRSMDHPHF